MYTDRLKKYQMMYSNEHDEQLAQKHDNENTKHAAIFPLMLVKYQLEKLEQRYGWRRSISNLLGKLHRERYDIRKLWNWHTC